MAKASIPLRVAWRSFGTGFLQRHRAPGAPLIVAGDFNRGERPARIAALGSALARLAGGASFRMA